MAFYLDLTLNPSKEVILTFPILNSVPLQISNLKKINNYKFVVILTTTIDNKNTKDLIKFKSTYFILINKEHK